jgi:hypothetical protein
MQDSTLDTQNYKEYLDSFLRQLKNELDVQVQAIITPGAELDFLDEYLLELNTFYYQSFHHRFFPLYEQIIKEDMRSLFHIGQEEAVLKKNIMTNLKQYACLYNQVKHTTALFKRKQQETQSFWQEYQRGSEERNVNLLYILKDLANGWNSFLAVERNLQSILEDNKLLTALNQHPAHAAAINLIRYWNPDNAKEVRDFNRLLAAWQLAIKLLIKFQENPTSTKDTIELLLVELRKADMAWDHRKAHPAIRTWYQHYIQRTFRLYMDSLNLSVEKGEPRHTAQIGGQFGDWLNALLIIIEQSMVYKSRGWDHLLNQPDLLTRIDKEYLKELDTYASRLLQSIAELILSLESSSRANYQYHCQRAVALLTAVSQNLKNQLENNLMSRGILLTPVIEQLRNQNDLLESRIELLNDLEEHSVNASGQCQTIIASLDSYLELLRIVKEELNRLLSPRQIKNSLQNIDLKIEHTAITAGSQLPPQYLYLIDEKAIATEEADAPEGRILYEEGDIFIFHLDELKETEIPKIIIAKKG